MNPLAVLFEARWEKEAGKPVSFLAFCLVLFGIPLGLVWILHGELVESRRRELIQHRRDDLEMMVANLRADPPELRTVSPDLIVLWRKAANAPDPNAAFLALKKRMKQAFCGHIDVLLIDSQGRKVPGLSDQVLEDGILRLLREDALVPNGKSGFIPPEHREIFADVLGPFMIGRSSGILSMVVSLSVRGRWTSMLMTEEVNGHMAVFLFRESLYWPEMIMALQLDLLRERQPGIRVGYLDIRKPLATQAKSLGRARPWLRPLIRDPEAQTGGTVVKGDWVMIQHPIRKHTRAVFALPIDLDHDGASFFGKGSRRRLGIALLLLFAFFSLVGWHLFFTTPQPFCSLRWKIGLLLLYLVALPLLLLGLAAWKSLGEFRSVLEQQLWARQRRTLQEIEFRYHERLGRMESSIISSVRTIGRLRGDNLPRFLETIGSLRNRFNPQLCDIIGLDGKVIAHVTNAWDTTAKQIATLLQTVAGAVCADLNLGGGRNLSPREQLMTATGEMIGLNVGLMYSAVTRYLGELFSVQLEQATNFAFLHPVYDQGGGVQGMIVLGWDRGALPLSFFRTEVARLASHSGEISVGYGDGIMAEMMLRSMPCGDEVARRVSQVRVETFPVSWKTFRGERGFYFTGGRTRIHETLYLMAVSNDERIRRELAPFAWRFALIGFIFAGMGLLTARLLAARFLVPIGHLTEGVRAIERRQFSHRIPVGAHDELGRLSETFNGMMSGFKELEIARLVQERFFPRETVMVGGWEVFGTCISASRVGGDYLDYFPVGDDRIGLVIGDVSGHGVGAALVVAMAKALIAHPETVFEPGRILDQLQRVFSGTLQRRKMMSCCVVLFEPATGRLRSANAGHNLPFVVRGTGRVDSLKPGGKPLGTKNKPFVEQEEFLAPADWVFLYTDGFIEAESRFGGGVDASIGYERVGAALPDVRRNGARETETALREWHTGQAAPVPQADDSTVMVLCRQPHRDDERA